MKGIGAFFEKFKNLALKDEAKKEAVADAIYKIINQKIEIKNINIKNHIAIINGDQALKSEVFIKKKAILDLIPKDIKIVDIK